MVLEGLENPVPYPCLWNSKGVLGRLNRRWIGDREFRHGFRLEGSLDEFAMAHGVWYVVCLVYLDCCFCCFEQKDAPSVQSLSVNF